VTAGRVREVRHALHAAGTIRDESGSERSLLPTAVERPLADALAELLRSITPTHTLEVGLAFGVSTLAFCEALLDHGGPGARHVAIDPYERSGFGNAGRLVLREAGVEELVEFHEDDSHLVLPELERAGRLFDAAFVDGDHRFESVFVDMHYCARMLEPGGLLLVDDCWMPAIRLAVDYFVTNLGYDLVEGVLGGQEYRRGRWRSRGQLAVLRLPDELPPRAWHSFVPFAGRFRHLSTVVARAW
jgi:predicted O-methyltransferase YrrM